MALFNALKPRSFAEYTNIEAFDYAWAECRDMLFVVEPMEYEEEYDMSDLKLTTIGPDGTQTVVTYEDTFHLRSVEPWLDRLNWTAVKKGSLV